jgi:phage terminase large subunit
MSQKQIDAGKDKHETKYYYRYIGGWLERSEGAIYKNWIEGEYQETMYTGYGLDFGYSPDPLALIEISVDQKRKVIYMRECLYNTDLSEGDVINALTKVIPNKRRVIISDTNEPRTRLSIKKAGFNILPAKKGAGSIADGIRSLQDYEFIVDPSSNNLKAELNNYSWNNKKASIPIGEFNHLMDGLRYIFRYLTKKKGSRVRRVN